MRHSRVKHHVLRFYGEHEVVDLRTPTPNLPLIIQQIAPGAHTAAVALLSQIIFYEFG